jgi:hypothetical protein
MDKIKQLLQKAGVSEELAAQICESLANYQKTLREQFEKEYAHKVGEVKKVCVEETEAHKRELARRVQIFCETKGAAIEAHLAKQSAISESEALAKLTSIRALLEGITLSGGPNGKAQAGLEKKLKLAVEQRQRAVETANRQTAIAEKALKKNRELVTENTKLKKLSGETLTEGTRQRKPKGKRLDATRRQRRQPVSTRPTLVESQDRRPPAKPKQPHVTGTGSGFGVGDIAANMDEDLI